MRFVSLPTERCKNVRFNPSVLSVRVLETRNILGNEIFPDATVEQWHVSDDSIELPRGALVENSEGGLVRIVFVAFDRLETILKPAENWNDYRYYINSGKKNAIVSFVCFPPSCCRISEPL